MGFLYKTELWEFESAHCMLCIELIRASILYIYFYHRLTLYNLLSPVNHSRISHESVHSIQFVSFCFRHLSLTSIPRYRGSLHLEIAFRKGF